MKRFLSPLIVGLLTGFSTLMVHGQVSVSADIQAGPVTVQINSPSDFIQPLAAYGTWVDAPRYGRCWHPKDVSTDWQPYAYGQWVWTDAGWYWQSDEPWGWATCHYGSWTDDPSYGWLWIPGTQWAPAWVTWREGDNYIGWAPCGPNETVLPPSAFLFTGIHDFGRAFRGRGDFDRDNPTIIHQTRVINDFSTRTVNFDGRERRISFNRGPAVETVQRATGRTFQARPVQDVIRERPQASNLRENRQQPSHEQPNRADQEQRPNRDQHPGNPEAYQPAPNRSAHPQPPATPEQRQIQPTGREHGITTPQQRENSDSIQPRTPNSSEGIRPQSEAPRQVPPTGQEHGISTPQQEREVPNPAQPRTHNPSERPTPQPVTPREGQIPPTGKEHGISTPPQQREVPNPAQPTQPNRTERSTPQPSVPAQRQPQPTGQEHGTSFPPQPRETAHPSEANPRATQPAPREDKAPQPEHHNQDGNNPGNQ